MIEELNRLLFVAHDPEPADLAVVLGYHEPAGAARRARQGVHLYRAGLVPRLLFSGGAPRDPGGTSEAARMASLARSAGVPAEDILVEEASRNTFENVACSLSLLERRGLLNSLQRMILVSCPWHMGRSLRLMRQGLAERGRRSVRVLSCPHSEECTIRDWQTAPECRQRVQGEYELLRHLIGVGMLPQEL
jgi:uncharacterized SAM-binding protein YcdF (DUF218 family)